MKLLQEAEPVEIVGAGRERNFGITCNAKMYDLLMSKLYSDKPRAIVRELSSNAWDSHCEASTKDKPFKIHLPNKYEPWFTIRDYGTGMSKDTVKKIYTQLGQSTRSDSNDYIGAFGLGSKTPFGITKNFNVTSYIDGKANQYLCYINAEGGPAYKEVSSKATDEPNGVEIHIPVGNEYISKFAVDCQDLLRWFKPLPEGVTFIEHKVLVETDKYVLFEKPAYGGVLLGSVFYSLCNSYEDFSSTCDHINTLLSNKRIVLKMPIGSLEVTASREELHFSEKTKKALITVCEEVNNTIAADYLVKFDDPDLSPLDVKKLLKDIEDNVSHSIYVHLSKKLGTTYYVEMPRPTKDPTTEEVDFNVLSLRFDEYRTNPTLRKRSLYDFKAEPDIGVIFTTKDLETSNYDTFKMRKYMGDKGLKSGYLICGACNVKPLIEQGCGHLFVNLDTLIVKRTKRAAIPASKKVSVYRFSQDKYHEYKEIDLGVDPYPTGHEKYYVLSKYNRAVINEQELDLSSFNEYMHTLSSDQYTIFLSSKELEPTFKAHGAIHVDAYINKHLNNVPQAYLDHYRWHILQQQMCNRGQEWHINYLMKLSPNYTVSKCGVNYYYNCRFRQMCLEKAFKDYPVFVKARQEALIWLDKLYTKYPLLKNMSEDNLWTKKYINGEL